MLSRSHGFTLIELLVVVTIIGTLATMILTSLAAARSKSKDTRTVSNVRQLYTQILNDTSNPVAPTLYSDGVSFTTNGLTLVSSPNHDALTTDPGSGAITIVTNAIAPVKWFAIYGALSNGTYYCEDYTGYICPNKTHNNGGTDYQCLTGGVCN